MSLLEVKGLSKSYRLKNFLFSKGSSIEAIKNVSFTLDKGKTLAIVGESGSGKSTLARQIIGIEKASKGQVLLNQQLLNFANPKDRRNRFRNIRMIFQNPYDSLNPRSRIGDILDEVLQINTQLTNKQRSEKIADTLMKVGLLPEHQLRYPQMFSGGQRQRIAIARAIILEPQIIIADEPLSALDVSIQAQILNLLQELQEQMEISLIFISHDLNVVEHIADQVMVMYRGEVIEYGNIEQIFDNPKHPYTQTLFASTPMYRKRFPKIPPLPLSKNINGSNNGCKFAPRCYQCQTQCLSIQPALVTHHDQHKVACLLVG